MSRIGRKPINIPAGVEVNLADGVITVKGPKGTLTQNIHKNMKVEVKDNEITVSRPNDDKENRALHGLTRKSKFFCCLLLHAHGCRFKCCCFACPDTYD